MKIPRQSLKDPLLEKELLDNGFVVVPFFDSATVSDLKDFYQRLTVDETNEIFASTHSNDLDYKRRINEKIKSTYKEQVEQYFHNPLILGGTFVVKPPGKGVSHPHLDWNLVHEGPFRSCNVWVPLIDLDEVNGVIEVLPGSHKLLPTYRGPNIPDRTNDLQEFFWNTMTKLYLKAGQALIYDHRLIHGSRDNMSDVIRPATACAVTNKTAELRLYYLNQENWVIETFTGNNIEYLLSNSRLEKPTEMEWLGSVENYDTRQLTHADFDFLGLPNDIKQSPFARLIQKLFN